VFKSLNKQKKVRFRTGGGAIEYVVDTSKLVGLLFRTNSIS